MLSMPQGISSAPEEYQHHQYEESEGLNGVEVIADGTLVFEFEDILEEAIKDHDRNLKNLLKRAREKNIKFSSSKLCLHT